MPQQVTVAAHLPADLWSEQLLCAAAMLRPDLAPRLAALAPSADFTSPWLRRLWEVVEGCLRRSEAPILPAVAEGLALRGPLKTDGELWLFTLCDDMLMYVGVAGDGDNLDHYARTVHKLAERRRAAAAALRGDGAPRPRRGRGAYSA